METLELKADRDLIAKRISALTPTDQRRWGRMSVGQMVCHLCDAYRSALGEKAVSPATGFFQRTIMKWLALRVPLTWPKGVRTRPEVEQGVGGTAPVEFERDRATLIFVFDRFCEPSADLAPTHPFFGPMTRQDWLRWGYLHADHHLRQFGR
ncbi:MAG TPA: DUF1569 domain-containing protein [Candidatus Acidoferrum sp.]|jgi:hypothetical protein|nr:DUF1569 domain-containing protein [Candidatus Acidoferrum sp.]